jgi:hypothetical protein
MQLVLGVLRTFGHRQGELFDGLIPLFPGFELHSLLKMLVAFAGESDEWRHQG